MQSTNPGCFAFRGNVSLNLLDFRSPSVIQGFFLCLNLLNLICFIIVCFFL